ncbi:FtsQ-type POTRA domain-containing protein [Paenarthrobacter ilicis]|uniref:Cell division protein FtsQ n=1 Tax=Paenarthrobacter ilicis TaxID=43665 RepID=A0ABX0TQ40_9MICC|nr:cell division protein FtsQ [Paenarthrobacter ilicis]NIJ03291.1 cell division protein FtsQ [Paenarthrobacter ilicis]
MPSTRKPTLRTGTAPASQSPDPSRPKDTDAVISAERPLETGERQPSKPATTGGQTKASKPSTSSTPSKAGGAAASGNVIAFPEPKRKRQRRVVLWTLLVVTGLVAAIIAGAVFSPVLAVKTISVDGTKLLAPDAVQKALSSLQGKPLPQVSEQEINELLKPLVQVKSATMEARPPSELLVHVTERVPVALLKQGDTFVMVDVDGVQLGATKDLTTVALPLIDTGSGANNPDLFAAITAVLDTLPADVLARMSTASAASPDAVELKLVDGKTVVWGNAEEKELKAKALEALLKMPEDPKVPVRVYDVSVPRHPFTK